MDGISDTVHPWVPESRRIKHLWLRSGGPSGQRGSARRGAAALPVPELVAGRGRGTPGQLAASAFQTRGSSREIDGRPAGFEGCPRAAASSKKETAGARRRQRCWPLTLRSCSALERTLDRMQCDEHPADMRLHNLQRQVAARPHAWIS